MNAAARDDAERRHRLVWRIVAIVCAVALAAFFVWVMRYRFANAETPYALHGDQQQSIGHYWRYKVAGSFPKGHLISDYAEAYHSPPLWWPIMAPMSAVLGPLIAARILGLVAYALFALGVAAVVGRRTVWALGFLVAVVALRNPPDSVEQITGGMARSLSPALLLLFMYALMERRHRLALATLVLQAGIYPSIVIPCGVTYGAYCVLAGPTMRDRLRRCAGMFVAGLIIIVLGLSQNRAAPEWWGAPVTYEEAAKMPAWHVGGRFPEVPHRDLWPVVEYNLTRPFKQLGSSPAPDEAVGFVGRHMNEVFIGAPLAFVLVGGVANGGRMLWRRRRWRLAASPSTAAPPPPSDTPSVDAASADAAGAPAALRVDAPAALTATLNDAAPHDAAHDTAAHDAAAHDTAAHDAAAHDAAARDTAAHDAAAHNSAARDTVAHDTAEPDTAAHDTAAHTVATSETVASDTNALTGPVTVDEPAPAATASTDDQVPPNPFPWESLWVLAGGLASYAIVRGFAFKFFLPSRQVGFIVPFVVIVTLPLLVWWGVRSVWPRSRLAPFLVAVLVTCVPAFAFRGHGGGRTGGGYGNKNAEGPLYMAIRKLPFDDEIACDVQLCNYMMPLGQHVPYSAETLTHPLRAGYYRETERRLIENMRLLHATSLDEVETFLTNERVRYFAYRTTEVGQVSKRLFKPVSTSVAAIFRKGRDKPRLFAEPPKEATLFRRGPFVLVDLEKMVAALKRGPSTAVPSPSPSAPSPPVDSGGDDEGPTGPED